MRNKRRRKKKQQQNATEQSPMRGGEKREFQLLHFIEEMFLFRKLQMKKKHTRNSLDLLIIMLSTNQKVIKIDDACEMGLIKDRSSCVVLPSLCSITIPFFMAQVLK